MSKGGRTGRQRAEAASELQRAGALLEAGRFAEALPLLRRVAPVLESPAVEAAVGDCLHALGKPDEALAAYADGFGRHPQSPELALRLASRMLEQGRFAEALPAFRIAKESQRHDAGFARAFAYAALQAEQWAEAELQARSALEREQGDDARMLLGLSVAAQSRFAEAAAELERSGQGPARTLAARLYGLGGNLKRALQLYGEAEAAGAMSPADWASAAQAAAFLGERERSERYLGAAEQLDPGPATQLAAAQLALLLGQPERALSALGGLSDSTDPVDRPLALALTGRAHRLAERYAQAEEALSRVAAEAPPRVLGLVRIERGHLRALAGDFEGAEALFREALELDASDLEARQGLERAQQRLSWERGVLADAGRQVDAARAEADAVRRAVNERESELARLKKQLAELEHQRRAAEKQAREAESRAEAARSEAEAERRRAVRGELEAREAEARAKVDEAVAAAFAGRLAEVPQALVEALRVAELTYQKALQTDLPGAGVAVLYSGVLERALYLCIVGELDRYLDAGGRRASLLSASRRDDRRGRPEYLDHFVGAFDREHPLRAPGLGEVARALRRRGEPHLAVVREFLETHRGYPPAFLDALAAFVDRSKEKLRDPVAHGRILEIADREVAEFRRALLADFDSGPGVLFRLAFPRG